MSPGESLKRTDVTEPGATGIRAQLSEYLSSTLLFGLTPTDPVSLLFFAALLMLAVAPVAGYLPSRRDARGPVFDIFSTDGSEDHVQTLRSWRPAFTPPSKT